MSARLAATRNPMTEHWPFDVYRRALDIALSAFVDNYRPRVDVDLRSLVSGQLMRLWRRPSSAEARVWGAQPYGEDFYNVRWHPLATPLTLRRLLTRAGIGRAEWRQPTYWLAGTIAVSPPLWRWPLGWLYRHRSLPARLARVPRRLRAEFLRRRK